MANERTKLEQVEIYIDPIQGETAEVILKSISANKIFLTRLKNLDLESKIISKSTPLFTLSNEEEIEDENSSEKNIIEIDSTFINKNSNITQLEKEFVATENGLFIIENDVPKIIPVSLDGSCDVRLSKDNMTIIVDIYPSVDDNPINTYEDIVEKISQMGVKADVKENELKDKLNAVENEKKKFLNVCIVEGKPAINGIDGRFENRTNKNEKIKDLDFGEFHKVNPAISVKEKEVIAILHPPTDGTRGNDVFENTVEPIPGIPTKLKLGKHTCFSDDKEKFIIAKKDGFIDISDTSISITDTFTVRGNIDFDSGNIIGKGSLKVVGNVLNDFTLNLSKDIEIGGYVGDANLEAGQNILIHGGFLGQGKGVIKAEGDIELKFVENQKVLSRGCIFLNKDTLNANIFAKNKIVSKTNRSIIVGGHAIAGEHIEVHTVGNNIGTETVLEVGFDYLKRNSIVENKNKQSQLRNKLEEVDKNIFEFARMKRRNTEAQKKMEVLADLHKKLVAAIESIKAEVLKTNSEIYIPTTSSISIHGTIYPGVRIGINGRFMKVTKQMRMKTFILSKDNEVVAM
ncbi:MAG: DUF342 domain-containing protein [Ignavibacteriae bacterium]|nr:DUF342 domain-containing protein [Ignavibacteriota bacterium]